MSEADSTAAAVRIKPCKPYPAFPLTPHPSGRWCKKIRGKLHYFGPWADPDGALAKYLERKDDLHAGRTPKPDTGTISVKDVANAFLNLKQQLVDAGELLPLTWSQYKRMADELVRTVAKTDSLPTWMPMTSHDYATSWPTSGDRIF